MIPSYDTSSPGSLHRRCARIVLVAFVLFTAGPASAQVTGLSYTFSGLGSRVFWDDEAGLDEGFVYGGELGLGFGEALELSGLYVLGDDFKTDFSMLTSDEAIRAILATLPARTVDVRRFGGRLRLNVGTFQFNLGRGKVVPFLSAGTGIIRFAPVDLDRSESIYLDASVGFAVSLAHRYTLSLAAENTVYRYSPGTTFFTEAELNEAGLTIDGFSQQTVYNPAATLALKLYLGGRQPGELSALDQALQRQFGGNRFRLAVEPFYGQIDFNDAFDFPQSQALVGLGVGFDLGAYVGLRAFYWRATNEESLLEDGLPDDLYDLQFYGGELNLSFGRQLGRGITPYLLLGGGYVDIGENYVEQTGLQPENRYFASGGLGVEIPVSASLKLQGNVRSLLMSTEDVEDLSRPGNVFASFMYSAGLNFHLGGRGAEAGDLIEGQIASSQAESRDRDAALERALARLQARLDSLEAVRAVPGTTAAAGPMPLLRADTMVVEGDTMVVMRESGVAEARSNISDRTITVPVPEQGEIYIRFGEPEAPRVETVYAPPTVITLGQGDSLGASGLTDAQIQALVRQEMQALASQGESLTPEELAANMQALEARLERRLAEEARRLRTEMATPSGEAASPEAGQDRPAPVRQEGILSGIGRREREGISPYLGYRSGEGPSQVLLGVRAHYRVGGRRLRFMPEFALGFGDGTSINAASNVVLPLAPNGRINPYAGAGIGLLSDAGFSGLNLALNLLGGVEYTVRDGMTFFGEYSTFDFLEVGRVLFGYRLRF